MNESPDQLDCQPGPPSVRPAWPPWFCPLPIISVFWKIAFGVFGLLLVISVVTLWLLAFYVATLSADLRLAKDEIVRTENKVLDTINGHKQLTMENRAVTAEIRGILNGWIEERRVQLRDKKLK
jgi:hypothetical protein